MSTIDQLREALSYDPETGEFRWRIRPARQVRVGAIAGTPADGYVVIFFRGGRYLAHRLAWAFVHGRWPEGQIDHKDRVRSNNRIANLRDVTGAVNQQNKAKAMSNSKTGLLGVSPRRNRFIAVIQVDRKQKYLGLFDTAEEASAAYLQAKRVHHAGAPEHA